ncbi:hypothetical protein G7077_01955 [Sphingomonas piscis]|uniref:Uncharacterized protein n=1 Tax=Sphingomonas piscis TaxID=2714943 RepID=A0A6G7YM89_9SPHN|nr:hypothetical protein [Sphingomonas piscis]QIK77859.1 hypothetical protein G7077_01955 [Sphingomonas piscis]
MLGRIALLAVACAAPAAAQGDLASKMVNTPSEVSIYGGPAKVMDDPAVQGGKFVRVDSPGKPNAWDIGVSSAVTKPVKSGDKLVLAFFAKSANGGDITLPHNGLQLNAAPYTPVFSQPVTIGAAWKLHQVAGKADKDYPAGGLGVAMHLSAAKQVVDLGPVIVLNLGQ